MEHVEKPVQEPNKPPSAEIPAQKPGNVLVPVQESVANWAELA